ncbi:MAG: porin [Burkholderiales bacterium]|nr:porin [Phycisphaerae bacterium]
MFHGSKKAVLVAAVALAMVAVRAQAGALETALEGTGPGNFLTQNNVNVGGWVEASTTWGLLDDPEGDVLAGRAFDFEHADPTLNQIGIYLDRQTDYAQAWDLGGRFEMIYGADARFTAANGSDLETGAFPENQFDITQLYAEVVIPVGTGLKTKIGKFNTALGYEYVNPTQNALYSHSFIFGLVPYTHTGVLASYNITETGNLSIGVARGWDQSLEDNNDAIEGLVFWTDKVGDQVTYALNLSVGPQTESNDHYRTAVDFWADYAMSEDLVLGVNADYVYDSAQGQDGDAAHTYGAALYAKYNPAGWRYVGLNARLEWFEDTSRISGFDSTLYEATLGATITPMAGHAVGQFWKIRPEVRYDYASNDIFNAGTEDSQLTAAIETLFSF